MEVPFISSTAIVSCCGLYGCPSEEGYGLPRPRGPVARVELPCKVVLVDKLLQKRLSNKLAAKRVRERIRANDEYLGSFPHRKFGLPTTSFEDRQHYRLYLLTLLAVLWLLLFLAENCCRYLTRSLSVTLLSSQALEYILVSAGDVEENPGPTYLTDKELTGICNCRLVEDDGSVVLKAVSSVAGRYSSFLRILGLPESQLSEIKAECRDNPQECLQKGIIYLLQENFNTDRHGPLTWRRLVVAVADTAGGNNHTLARKIAAEHKELPDSSVDRERESLKSAGTVASPCMHTQQKYKQSGSFAVMFPKLKRSLGRSLKPDDLKEFLRYFCNPAFPEHCLVDQQLYINVDSTSQILDSLHPTYINPANLLLLQEIVDNFGSKQSKRLLHDYKSQWE